MTRIFVYEWTCCVEDASPSLRCQGWAMLAAVLEDFQRCPNIQTTTLVHERFDQFPPGEVVRVRDETAEKEQFYELAAEADATLVIAPETGGLLAQRAKWVEDAGGENLVSSASAITLTSDKLRCARHWQRQYVRTPPTREFGEGTSFPAILKPRDGAGSENTFLIQNRTDLANCLRQLGAQPKSDDFILQEFVVGKPASVAFLCGPEVNLALPPARQILSDDGCFHYLGGTVPLPTALAERATHLGLRAIEAIPGLRGYVGVDMILGDPKDGSGDYAIEINPRLTTSYLGLRRLTEDNLALAMLQITLGQDTPQLRWRDNVIHFAADGTLANWPAFE